MQEQVKPDKSINIKGLVCPHTFVRAKLAVEGMDVGEVLEIILDYPEAANSIPKSMQDHGQTVISVDKINDTDWRLLIKKEVD